MIAIRSIAVLVLTLAALAGCSKTDGGAPSPAPAPVPAPAPHHKLGDVRPVAPPAPQPAWSTSNWWVDPVAGSDTNNCTTAVTPCATWQQIVLRWGTLTPYLAQSTVVTFLSDQGAGADPVIATPIMLGGAAFTIQGTLKLQSAGSLSSVTAKNRTNAVLLNGTLLGVADAGVTITAGMLVQNNTHASMAWVDTFVSNVAGLTQPVLAVAANPVGIDGGSFAALPAEVNTWANADAISVLVPTKLNLKLFSPTTSDAVDAGGATPYAMRGYLQNVWVPDPGPTAGFTPVRIGNFASIQQCRFDAKLVMNPDGLGAQGVNLAAAVSTLDNVWMAGGAYLRSAMVNAGAVGTTVNLASIYIQNDANSVGFRCGGWCRVAASQESSYGGPVIWGPGNLDVLPGASFVWPKSILATSLVLLDGGTIRVGGLTSVVPLNWTAPLTVYVQTPITNINLAALIDAGGFLAGDAGNTGPAGVAQDYVSGARMGPYNGGL